MPALHAARVARLLTLLDGQDAAIEWGEVRLLASEMQWQIREKLLRSTTEAAELQARQLWAASFFYAERCVQAALAKDRDRCRLSAQQSLRALGWRDG